MSFSSQRAVDYLIDLAIPILVANWLYKTPAMLKCQQFEDNKSDEMESRSSKRQRLDLRDNEKEEGLDKFEDKGKGEGIRYVPLPFVIFPQKELNRLTDMSKGIKSLNCYIYIPKIG